MKWKAKYAAPSGGAFFTIKRKIAGSNTFVLVGNTGEKKWTDVNLVQGTASATYIIQGHRGGQDGEASDQICVQLGISGGSTMVTNAELKMAA